MNARPVLLVASSLESPHVGALQAGITHALKGSPHWLAVTSIASGEIAAARELAGLVAQLQPLGAVLAPPLPDSDALTAALAAATVPQVRIAPDAIGEPARLICSNDRQGMSDATNYLIALGHKRIGFISISDGSRAARERELGFIDALAEHRLDFGAELVMPAKDTADAGREAGLVMLAVSPRPSAILASTSAQAAGVLQAAREGGVAVPEGLSIMGFGASDLACALSPPLTAMHVPWLEMGFTAAAKLLDPARAQALPMEFLCELVVRESTGPVAG